MTIVQEIEKQLIVSGLIKYRGNQKRTAQDLRMPKSTLHDRIRKYGINKNDLPDVTITISSVKELLHIK